VRVLFIVSPPFHDGLPGRGEDGTLMLVGLILGLGRVATTGFVASGNRLLFFPFYWRMM